MDEFTMDQECERAFRTLTDGIGVLLGERFLLAKGANDTGVLAAAMLLTAVLDDTFSEFVPWFSARAFAEAIAQGEGVNLDGIL